jgi:hypothetical protein
MVWLALDPALRVKVLIVAFNPFPGFGADKALLSFSHFDQQFLTKFFENGSKPQ